MPHNEVKTCVRRINKAFLTRMEFLGYEIELTYAKREV